MLSIIVEQSLLNKAKFVKKEVYEIFKTKPIYFVKKTVFIKRSLRTINLNIRECRNGHIFSVNNNNLRVLNQER